MHSLRILFCSLALSIACIRLVVALRAVCVTCSLRARLPHPDLPAASCNQHDDETNAKAQVAEPPKRPPSSSLAAGYAPTGNEYRDRKARTAGGRGSAARRAQTPTAARHTTAARSRQTDR